MGGYSTKRMLLLLAPIMFLHLLISSSSGAPVNSSENRVCISKKGRPYELEGKLPRSADLNLCNVFSEKTCCSASRMLPASLALVNLATHGEASQDCLDLFELLECSICHPDVGTQPGPLRICASLCDRVFEACSDAYFRSDVINNVIVPCGASNGTICEKASNWETNGTRFCKAMGFTVQTDDEPCYGSKPGFGQVVIKTETVAWFENLKKLVRDILDMALVQQFSWVAVLVGLGAKLFNRWCYQQQVQAVVQRDARRLRRNRNRRT